MSGVASMLFCGRGPKFSDFQRQAMRRFLTLSRLIWSSAEYLLLPRSPPQCGHSPFVMPVCPETITDVPIAPATRVSIMTNTADLAVMDAPVVTARLVEASVCSEWAGGRKKA